MNGRDYIEVNPPLKDIPCHGHPMCRENNFPFLEFERIIKHFHDIASSISEGSRAIVLLCCLQDAQPFVVPVPDRNTIRIQKAAAQATRHGMESWQVNLRVDHERIEFLRCFKLDLFPD